MPAKKLFDNYGTVSPGHSYPFFNALRSGVKDWPGSWLCILCSSAAGGKDEKCILTRRILEDG